MKLTVSRNDYTDALAAITRISTDNPKSGMEIDLLRLQAHEHLRACADPHQDADPLPRRVRHIGFPWCPTEHLRLKWSSDTVARH